MAEYHTIKEKEVLEKLNTSEKGLSENQAQKRLQKYGKNELVELRKFNAIKIFISQFFSLLIIILILAAGISASLGHWVDFYVIICIVVINSLFGFIQEYKAEKAIQKLKQMLVPKAKVLRDNKVIEVDSRTIVPGDILILSEGDKIMADARLISISSLKVSEAALTGESIPEEKTLGILKLTTPLGDRTNMIYQGTQIVNGSCKALVVATGMNTEYGKIASLVQEVEPEKNPLKKKLDQFAKKLAIITLIILAIIVGIGISAGFDKFEIFFTAVSLAVSVIPEGLPAVITISLALATQKMLKVNTLIRKLPASETLGRTTVICTDKTGTITSEKMQVGAIYINKKIQTKFKKCKEALMLFKIGILCNNARLEKKGREEYILGDPTEQALILSAKKLNLDKAKITAAEPRIQEFAFSSSRKLMSIVRSSNKGKEQISYVKGAPEKIIANCSSELVNGKVIRISQKRKNEILKDYETLASRGMRVLGFSYKTVVGPVTQKKAETNLTFVGLQAMIDPPRPEVKKAIEDTQKAGIKTIMITGDALLTAVEVGGQIGLKGKAITTEDLEKMSDQELKEEVNNVSIFARATPQDKLRIIDALKANQEIVAMTGDGVNDTPALKKADIGIAVNRGTDVAKDSSDMILLDNNFASITKAVKQGRRVYDNIKKFIKFLLAANFYEVFLVLSAILIWKDPMFLPLLPIQILWINLVTDSFPALALSQEEAEKDIMKRPPGKAGILEGTKGFIFLSGILGLIITFLVFYNYLGDIDKARTMAVTTSVIFQMFLAFNCKSTKSVFKSPKNKYLVYAVAFSILLHLIALYTPMNLLFSFTPLLVFDWILILGLAIISFFIIEGFKKIKFHKKP